MSKPLPEPLVIGLAEHPAVQALARFDWSFGEPVAVTTLKARLKRKQKSDVYRLHEAGPGGTNVIAKRCPTPTARFERTMHEVVLPGLSIPALTYYGTLDDVEENDSWVFLEDAGEERCGDDERVELMRWLAALHTSAVAAVRENDLPARGSQHYLHHLRDGRERIENSLDEPHLAHEELDLLKRILHLFDRLERRWPEIESMLVRFPQTLVHGDLSSKNVRVRRSPSVGLTFFALDWETAGSGAPAADVGSYSRVPGDVANLPLEAYLKHVAPHWGCNRSELQQLADVGVIFRMTASIDWASYSLRYPPARKPLGYLATFERRLLAVMPRLGWI